VRAKVAALRSQQANAETALAQCRSYVALAERLLAGKKPVLLITYGLPGCGKTAVSQIILEKLQAIRIRSDVERKRLFGLEANQTSRSDSGIYSQEATERTYRHLLNLARQLLENGYPVIVDAAFLMQREREQFHSLANELAVPFAIASVSSDNAIQRQRIQQRQLQNADASDADIAVLEKLRAVAEPLQTTEQEWVIEVINNGTLDDIAGNQSLRKRLDQLQISVDADKR
jgi:predicted kinase